ncbi:DUF4913 domain-containing protein [Frigoribacterium sp. PhB118]|uniref:DUF4913 domain-containing protein n=1 Tax=Frigoribacterium sp. PhB118 TaxID=2485175 RepID=UPI000F4A3160|nr:DUF4913 domain-containing protein [Frigoribacterium sp. PhB118]ROS48758.1 uncharacterized protein DUF4913 [Frigoribacterium sp. PhB118]
MSDEEDVNAGEISEAEADGYNPDDPADAAPLPPLNVMFAEWVQEHFATVEFFTAEAKIRWCPEWWKHTEAVSRLKALWVSHTNLDENEDASALSSWWLHHWDAHRAILFHDRGPFRNCDVEHGHLWSTSDKRVLPVPAMPPEDWEG